ncbi:hypothetical protein CLV41_106255 [Roseibium marinum]|uniref:Uncharacterized protein n=2 Tax=Roseibium marinum TaxID=281252 RepID=A0A2S3USE5_9HYPH|nr:hypothetical protein CLV41_106255 [Roseibium marinum]
MTAALPFSDISTPVALNGGCNNKVDHPAIPQAATKRAPTAEACREAGGGHFPDVDAHRAATGEIRRTVGKQKKQKPRKTAAFVSDR